MNLKEANARAGLLRRRTPTSETQRKLMAFQRQIRKVDYTIVHIHRSVDTLLDALELEPKSEEIRKKAEQLLRRSRNFQEQKATLKAAIKEIQESLGLPTARI